MAIRRRCGPDVAQGMVNAQSYTKSNMLRMLLGDGLATSEGELWRRQRNLLLLVFSRERLPGYGPIITRHIDRTMGTWKDDGIHDIYRDMMRLTLDVAAEAFLGTQLNGRQDALLKNLEIILDEFIVQADQCFMVPPWVPTRSNRAIRQAVKTILEIVEEIIRDRRAEIANGASGAKDLLALLLEAQQSGVQISDELIGDETTTFLLGGHETTAIALAWVWHLLAQYPDVEQRLAKHLDVELCGRPTTLRGFAASHLSAAGSQGIATVVSTGVVYDAPRRSRCGNRRLSRAERRDHSDGHMGRAS